MKTANYLLSILKSNLNIFWSWGSHKFVAIENGLRFNVDGFIHKGIVEIIYNEGSDLFDIKLLSNRLKEVKFIEGIYIDQLIDVIDDNVECCKNYEQRVRDKYSLPL
ncbi:hypothetical protein [Dysgonomonas macrotermitis]|uniref:Uncharacterized protein n=1 Tax=Dysgonomonas macrotermitis TaxID=1346286 RepID=A0A1M5ER89_9BACT|nr:hypothetical protein [Dysgonomonas macrotermitis]SHF81739.1 hypothetical protein SAMN05444362_110117 [Dysgonomonas macrotermitis]